LRISCGPNTPSESHTALVSKDDFDRIQQLLTQRQTKAQHPRTVSSQYLLSGLLHCGKCDSAMSGCWAKSGQYFYYECTQHQKQGKEACDCGLVSKDKLERFVLERIRGNILTDENIRELVLLVMNGHFPTTTGENLFSPHIHTDISA